MHRFIFFMLLSTGMLVSCSETPSSQSPAIHTVATVTSNQALTSTPINPTLTPSGTPQRVTATASPYPTLSIPHDRPMIAYESASPDEPLVLLDLADGITFAFDFPIGALFATPMLDGLSPDARYFVYYEGGSENPYGGLDAKPPDFGMRVLELDNQKVIFDEQLLSPAFPKDLEEIVAMTEDEYWMVEPDRAVKLKNMNYTMQMTVLNYLRTVAWSPDGSLLAYASQNPGPTSDLYFLDPEEANASRVTDELGHVLDLTWAPDSSAIALETTLYDRHMRRVTTYLITQDGFSIGSVERYYFYGWLDETIIMLLREVDFGDPFFDLTLMSAFDKSLYPLWKGSFDQFAVSPDFSCILMGSSEPSETGESPGLFLKIFEEETSLQLSKASFWKVAYWGSERFAFAASAPNTGVFEVPQTGGTYGVVQNGELYLIDEGNWYLLPSSDQHLLAAYGPHDKIRGLRIFDGDGKLLSILSDEKITCLHWNAAASHLAYQIEDRLYLWGEGDESTRQIADHLQSQLPYGECAFRWVNDKP